MGSWDGDPAREVGARKWGGEGLKHKSRLSGVCQGVWSRGIHDDVDYDYGYDTTTPTPSSKSATTTSMATISSIE